VSFLEAFTLLLEKTTQNGIGMYEDIMSAPTNKLLYNIWLLFAFVFCVCFFFYFIAFGNMKNRNKNLYFSENISICLSFALNI
jgi:hypothetical protein